VAVGEAGGLADATILILEGREAGTRITAMFNPTQYSRSKSVQYGEQSIAGLSSPVTQFVSGEARTLSMELFFDASQLAAGAGPADVGEAVAALETLLTVDPSLGAPPSCTFVWGKGIEFRALLENADEQFTMFRPDGTPTRARVDVTFTEYRPPSEEAERSADGSGSQPSQRTVTEGDTLSGIAGEEYGDPGAWQRIASANGIDDPRALQPGTTLTIPPRQR